MNRNYSRTEAQRRRCYVLTAAILHFLLASTAAVLAGDKVPVETAAVLGPLDIRDSAEMATFDQLLGEAKGIGVNAVAVDVWWGKVEKAGDQQFDWSFYDTVFNKIRAKNLKIIPILSFHACGPGPGDFCGPGDPPAGIPLPSWLFTHFSSAGLTADDLKYESETCNKLDDAIAPWATATPAVLDEFREFMDAFEAHFASIAGDFLELNISLGPTGELRYPSYNQNDGWKFPDRGNFQAYSPLARKEFRNFALSSFGGLSGVSQRWGINLPNADAIRPPGGHIPCPAPNRRAQSFVDLNDHADTQFGKDFIDWYNDSLVEHGGRLLLTAHQAFGGSMQSIPLGMKIPGVHWQMMDCARHPRIAETTAGLVQTTLNLQPLDEARADAYGYKNILDMVAGVKNQTGRDIILHFTAVEMDNDVACGTDPDTTDNSMAEALVFWISHGAEDRNIKHKAENALACIEAPDPPDDPNAIRTWDRVRNAFTFAPYQGLSLLRLVRTSPLGCSSPNVAWDTDKGQYQSFIQDFVGSN